MLLDHALVVARETIMAKATSPIRLQAEFMHAAALPGKCYHRSTAVQIEYWADMGRLISSFIDPDTLLSVQIRAGKNYSRSSFRRSH